MYDFCQPREAWWFQVVRLHRNMQSLQVMPAATSINKDRQMHFSSFLFALCFSAEAKGGQRRRGAFDRAIRSTDFPERARCIVFIETFCRDDQQFPRVDLPPHPGPRPLRPCSAPFPRAAAGAALPANRVRNREYLPTLQKRQGGGVQREKSRPALKAFRFPPRHGLASNLPLRAGNFSSARDIFPFFQQ